MRMFLATLLLAAAAPGALLAAPHQPAADAAGKTDPAATAADAAPAAPPESGRADPDMRTFGGACLKEPAGADEQVGALAAALIPQVVGAGIDAVTAALDAAGTDKVRARSAVVPLEHAVDCIQVAKGLSGTARSWAQPEDMYQAKLMLELYLRQSADGTALLVAPTVLEYRETVNGRRTRSTKRNLYATITFADAAGEHPSTVTVPLGDFLTRSELYLFDAVKGPVGTTTIRPLGSANSVWIPNPFTRRDGKPAAEVAQPAVPAPSGAVPNPLAPNTPPAPSAGNHGAAAAGKGDAAVPDKPKPVRFSRDEPIAPISVTVVITETRPGNPIAKALAGILKGGKQGIVDAADPAKRAQAREAEQTAADTKLVGWSTSETKYAKLLQAYCAADADRRALAPDLAAAQLELANAARNAKKPLPFERRVDPYTGEGSADACAAARLS